MNRLAGAPNVELRFGDALKLDLAEDRTRGDEARRQPPVQHRHAARRREPRPSAGDRAVDGHGPARSRGPFLRSKPLDEGLRRGVGPRAAGRGADGLSPCLAFCVPSAPERRFGARRLPPHRVCRPTSVASNVSSRARSRTGARRLANSLELAGVAHASPRRRRSRSSAGRRTVRAEELAPQEFLALTEALRMRRAAAAAKINLALVVGPQRDDGKHELVTVYQRVALSDRIAVEHSAELRVDGLRRRHARAARARAAWPTATSTSFAARIQKRIPVAAGLGGGSSDAATALRLANDLRAEPRRGRTAARRSRASPRRRRAVFPRGRAAARHGRRHRAVAARPASGLLGPPRPPAERREDLDGRGLRRPSTREAARDGYDERRAALLYRLEQRQASTRPRRAAAERPRILTAHREAVGSRCVPCRRHGRRSRRSTGSSCTATVPAPRSGKSPPRRAAG